MKFKLKADCIVEANSIRDAFLKVTNTDCNFTSIDDDHAIIYPQDGSGISGEVTLEKFEEEIPPTLGINVSDTYPTKDKFGG